MRPHERRGPAARAAATRQNQDRGERDTSAAEKGMEKGMEKVNRP